MIKNVKIIFFVTTLLILLLSVTALSASDVSNDTTVLDNNDNVAVSEVSADTPIKSIDTNTVKNIKKEDVTTDLYVSDTDGSDDNSGTNTSPYKTIQKALDTTTADSTFNIHIAEGTYKGLGNTNLTINGNYNINIIGSENTIIDGEANYTMMDQLTEEFYWGSSTEWYPYVNGTGNYAMNITIGNGLLTISNLTIQNCWNPGGDNINSYPTATIDNYANLQVNNIKFLSNYGGVGSAIRSNDGSTLIVKDSLFDGNKKSSSTGNDGIIYNNGTATIINSTFQNNMARWGTILNDKIITIENCTIKDNKFYDGSSAYKFGAGIATDTGAADFFNEYTQTGLQTTINNTIFENNGGTDVYMGDGILILNNSLFTECSGIQIATKLNDSQQIINNITIENSIGSMISSSLSNTKPISFGIRSYKTNNLTITNSKINSENTLELHSSNTNQINNIILKNNQINGKLNISSVNNVEIINNTITTDNDYTIYLSSSNNVTIKDNTLESAMMFGDNTISGTATTLENNGPIIGQDITLTDETYPLYFNEDGTIKEGTIETGSKITLNGNFYNRKFVIDSLKIQLIGGTLYNSILHVKDQGRIIAQSIKFNNQDTTDGYVVLLETNKNSLNSLTITANTTNKIHPIVVKGNTTTLTDNRITLYGPSNKVTTDRADTIAIDVQSSNNTLTNSWIDIHAITNEENGEIVAINIQSADNTKTTGNVISNAMRGSELYDGDMSYGVKVINSDENRIQFARTTYNEIISNSIACKVYLENSDNNILNLIYSRGDRSDLIAEQTYSVILNKSNNNNLTNINNKTVLILNSDNINIQTATAVVTNNQYVYEVINSTNINMNGITITTNITDSNSGGIFIDNSENITLNNIKGKIEQYNIKINNSNNILVQNSNLNTTKNENIVLNNSNNISIINNYLKQTSLYGGDNAVTIINSDNILLENNTPYIEPPVYANLTDDNYNQFFTDGVFNAQHGIITLGSDLYNKNMTFTGVTSIDNPNNYTIYNTTIKVFTSENEESIFNNLNINNTNINQSVLITNASVSFYYPTIIVENTPDNVLFLYQNNPKNTTSKFYNANLTINSNDITVFEHNTQYMYGLAPKSEIINSTINVKGNNTQIISTNLTNILKLTMINSTINSQGNNQNIMSILHSSYSIIKNNNITMIGNESSLLLLGGYDTLEYNQIISIGNNNILLETPNMQTIQFNNITSIGDNNIIYSKPYSSTYKNRYYNNFIVEGNNNTIFNGTSGDRFYNNTFTATGDNNLFINASNNQYTGETLINNNITFNTTNHNPNPIFILDNSSYTLQNNSIIVTTTYGDTPIISITNGYQITIENNYIISNDVYGDNTIKAYATTLKINNNTPTTQLTIDDINTLSGQKINITARINVENKTITSINKGKITFKINGKTLKDENGKVIYAKVINGTATIENYQVPDTWNENTTIEATYSGSTQLEKLNSEKTNITITPKEITLTTEPITATIGTTTTLTATLSDNTINTGKIVFKINGKTVKDADGKVIYAKVVNGMASVEYTIPKNMKTGNYTITATYIGTSSNRLESNSTITVVKD